MRTSSSAASAAGIASVRSHQRRAPRRRRAARRTRPSISARAPRGAPAAARAGCRDQRGQPLALRRRARASTPLAGSVSSNSTRHARRSSSTKAKNAWTPARSASAGEPVGATAASDGLDERVGRRRHAREEELLLVAEVRVEQRLRDADRGRDLVHRDRGEAARGEQRAGGVERLALALGAREPRAHAACSSRGDRSRRRARAPARRTRRRAAARRRAPPRTAR